MARIGTFTGLFTRESTEAAVDKPLPRLPSAQPGRLWGVYESGTELVPDLLVREPIGDYLALPEELADVTHDSAGLTRVDEFVTRFDGAPPAALVNALSMYLCDYLVVNHGLTWRLTPNGTAVLQLDNRGDLADPTRGVTEALENRQPIAHRFIAHCQGMIESRSSGMPSPLRADPSGQPPQAEG